MQGPSKFVPSSQSPIGSIEQRLATIESQLAALTALISVQNNGSVVIRATNLLLETMQSFSIKSGSNADFRTGGNLTIQAGSNAELKAGGQLTVQASGITSVKGSMLSLNGGTKPIARLGDLVQTAGVVGPAGSPIPAGQVTGGNPNILA